MRALGRLPLRRWRSAVASAVGKGLVVSPQSMERLEREMDGDTHSALAALLPIAQARTHPPPKMPQTGLTGAQEHAVPALSGFRVGAVGLGRSGAVYLGANIEFAGASIGGGTAPLRWPPRPEPPQPPRCMRSSRW